nr:MAG: VP1 [Porcine polyomavirus]QBA83692.1 MAG: VP1 [Porcine polyomavirus]
MSWMNFSLISPQNRASREACLRIHSHLRGMSTKKGKRVSAPTRVVQRLPTQIRKGGVDVLATVPLDQHTEYKVELFLKPTFATTDGNGVFQSIGGPLTNGQEPNVGELLLYSLGMVQPPEIPNQVDENSMIVWELYRVETEVLFAPKTFSTGYTSAQKNIGGVEGPQFYFWAVGGEPLDVLGIKSRKSVTYPTGVQAPPNGEDLVTENTVRRKVDKPQFPCDCWLPDPSRNDNTRYFGRVIGGSQTPPVLTIGNSSTVPVVDEYGVGVLLLQGRLYVTSCDMLGTVAEVNEATLAPESNSRRIHAGSGRFFRLHFRQRKVKNPYTINLLYKQVFNKPNDDFVGQTGVTEVTMTQETQPLPTILEGTVGTQGNLVTEALRRGTAVLQTTTPLVNTQSL